MLKRLILDDIKITISAENQLWNIKADRSQIEQVIMNLVLNANDAMPRGGYLNIKAENVVIGEEYTKLHPYAKLGKYVKMTFSDTGCGMSEDIRGLIFEPFFTTKDNGRGTGLGLATVFGIIKQNNGFIEVDSEPDRGTTFKIYVPVCKQETPDERVKQSEKVTCSVSPNTANPQRKPIRPQTIVKL